MNPISANANKSCHPIFSFFISTSNLEQSKGWGMIKSQIRTQVAYLKQDLIADD